MSERRLRIGFPSNQIVLILMGILVLYLAADFGRQVIVSQQQSDDLSQVQAQIAASEEHQAVLQAQLEYSQSDAAAEAWAREVGWVKAGEVPVVIVAPGAVVPGAETQPNATPSGSGTMLKEWWNLFFGSD